MAVLQQDQRVTQQLRIDPKIILANSVLQLSGLELIQEIETELRENPALDTLDEYSCPGDCIDPASCPYCSAQRNNNQSTEENQTAEIESTDDLPENVPIFDYQANLNEDERDPFINMEAEITLQEHLRNELCTVIGDEDQPIGNYLINCLDERGWLDGTIEEIASRLGADCERVTHILEMLQTMEPAGIGARNLQECLLLQLRYLAGEEISEEGRRLNLLATHMISECFEHVTAHRYVKMARCARCTIEEVREALEYIRSHTTPAPASQYRSPWSYNPTNMKATVRPDVIVRRTDIGYDIEVTGTDIYALGINPLYREEYNAIKGGKTRLSFEDRKHFVESVDRAELFMRNINQRRKTLQDITRCIIEEQSGFMATGSFNFLHPLTRTRVAQLLGMHESTVSRATASKYVQLPNQEMVNFEVFFDSSLSIKNAIEAIIRQEDTSNPLSDKQIVERLREMGYDVARRTIVKYREAQKILSSTRRRR